VTKPSPQALIRRFANDLSALREAAGPSCPPLRQISVETGISLSTFYTALRGEHLPTRGVVVALVSALGGDVMVWQLRRAELEEALAVMSGAASSRMSGRRTARASPG
jgi:hypothetical protein